MPNLNIDGDLTHLISHENLHQCFGGVLAQNSKNEEADKWFVEGFADYYSDYINYKSGIINFGEYINAYNEIIRKYYKSIYKNTNNDELARFYWSGRDSKTIYYRGRIFAFELDHKIREYSANKKNLDDVIKFMMNEANMPKDKIFHKEYFLNSVKKVTGYDAKSDLQKYIIDGKPEISIPIIYGMKGEKAYLTAQKDQIQNYGFKFVKSRLVLKIKGIDSTSPAYKAGLRENDRFDSSWHSKKIKIRVIKNNGFRDIEFTPNLTEINILFYKFLDS